jgi:hypothetical protein
VTTEPRTILINFRVSRTEHKALLDTMPAAGARNLSDLVRTLVLRSIGHQVNVPELAERVADLEQKIHALALAQEEGTLP